MTETLAPPITPDALARELYEALAAMDPAQWSREPLESMRAQLDEARRHAVALVESWSTAAPGSKDERLRKAIGDIAAMLPDPATLGDGRSEWATAYEQLAPAYEVMATILREQGQRVRHLRPMNLVRTLVHAAMGLSVAVLFEAILTPLSAIIAAAAWCAWAWSLEITRRHSARLNTWLMWIFGPITRHHERHRVNSATWFGTGLLVLAVTVQAVPGVLGLLAVALGDPAAGLVGRRWGRTRLRNGRSLEGTLAFFVVVFAAGVIWVAGFHRDLGLVPTLVLAGVAALAGALAELFATKLDDNFAIPVVAGWSAAVVYALIGP